MSSETATETESSVVTLDDLEGAPHANAFPESEPKTIRLSLEAGESVPPHDHPGRRIVLHVLEGQIELRLDDRTMEVRDGQVVQFSGDRQISPTAIEETTAVVILAEAT